MVIPGAGGIEGAVFTTNAGSVGYEETLLILNSIKSMKNEMYKILAKLITSKTST
jgi:hypothetical protein